LARRRAQALAEAAEMDLRIQMKSNILRRKSILSETI
jgi:hypothetical protein